MKSQGSMVAEDRRVLLAEQNASMERLVNSISATINRDLPLRMEEIVRAEVHAQQLALLRCSQHTLHPQSCIASYPGIASIHMEGTHSAAGLCNPHATTAHYSRQKRISCAPLGLIYGCQPPTPGNCVCKNSKMHPPPTSLCMTQGIQMYVGSIIRVSGVRPLPTIQGRNTLPVLSNAILHR